MNKLQYETSPYLLQHKNNPVDWHPYSNEALDLAKKLDKPIFLSIGYSSCHWCHVMEKESFEDIETANLMNQLYINIKVDREERPDLDNIYMNYVQMLTGSGGWPLSVFLTPDLKPIFGGTYFPKISKYGRPSFKDVLIAVEKAYREKKDEIYSIGDEVLNNIASLAKLKKDADNFNRKDFQSAFETILAAYDQTSGGFGIAPKFPMFPVLGFLLKYYAAFNDTQALQIAEHTIRAIISGGIYDQIGGGLARYATDKDWIIPHFEKMLYDNAQFISILCETYQASQDAFYINAAEDVANFLIREMHSPDGGFYSAIDADSEGEEGKFYIFDYKELSSILDERELKLACDYYGITPEGNFEGKNILTSRCDVNKIIEDHDLTYVEFVETISQIRTKLFKYRSTRQRPLTDDKINSAWNALAISAFSKLYLCTGNQKYLGLAIKTADFVIKNLFSNNILYTTYKYNRLKGFGCLDSYAYLITALCDLYEASMIEEYMHFANKLFALTIQKFYSKEEDIIYYSPVEAKDLPIRAIDIYDNALPSGISQLILAYERIKVAFEFNDYDQIFFNQLLKIKPFALKYPLGFGSFLTSALFVYLSPKTIVTSGNLESIKDFRREFFNRYLPFYFTLYNPDGAKATLPILNDKTSKNKKIAIYVCENFSCKDPIDSIEEFFRVASK